MSSALVAVRYANGVEEEVPLKYGSNVIGKAGGPADVVLNSPALSRRHATITVGDKATDCTVEDLGSTNKTAIVTQSGDLQTLEPGTIYPLQQGSQIVMGDVQIMFSHNGNPRTGANRTVSIGSIPSTGHGNRNVMFVKTPATQTHSEFGRASTGLPSTRYSGPPLDHKVVFEHGRTDLGMNLPYDSSLLWIAESSLQMPLPEGWVEEDGIFVNGELDITSEERPQNVVCRNLYQEMRRKAEMESNLGTLFAEEALPRILVLDPDTQLGVFHYILPGRNVVGKAKLGVDITFGASKAMSKRHAYVELREGRVFAGDLGSTNGSFIGEFPQTDSRRLEAGQEVEIHDGQLLLFADIEATLAVPSGGSIVRATTAAPSSIGDSDDQSEHQGPHAPGGKSMLNSTVQADVDYDEIRRIIREEVSNAAGFMKHLGMQEGRTPADGTAGVRGVLKGVRHVDDEHVQDQEEDIVNDDWGEDDEALGMEGERGAEFAPPEVEYDVDAEVRLAEEMEQLEGIVEGTVGEHVKTPGSNKAAGGPESRKKGFLGRQEARRQQMMDWAKGYYRKQSPYEDLGKHMLPTGALHRIMTFLDAVPHLCVLSTVSHSLRRAAGVTKPWKTVNGDMYGNLWGVLKLSGTRCADGHTLIAGLGAERLSKVSVMDLSGISTVTDDTLAVIAEQCPALQSISLKCRVDVGPQVTDVGLEDISACCMKLKTIELAWCTKLTDFTMQAIAKNCRELEKLDISFCSTVTDEGLLDVLQHCDKLESLKMESCDNVTEHGIVAIAQQAPRMKNISLAGCLQGCTTLSVIQIARECQLLTHIDLTGVAGLEDAAVWQLSRGCRWLQEILLAWCVQLTDTSFIQIAANCPLLTHLSLRGCNKVSDSAIVQLAQNCCYLKDLDLRGCDKVSQGGMDALAVMIPSCIVHFLDKSYNKKPGLNVTK